MISGIINIDKIGGFSSFWHDKFIKNITGANKIGHIGTLDPIATGLLTICIGKATRLINYLSGNKIYIVEALWGVQTDTDDITGNIIRYSDNIVDKDDLLHTIKTFIGIICQTPPFYAAIKINGKPLYDYARNGQKVDIASREVEIYDITLLEHHKTHSKLKICCSKGTYIRSIIRDIGERLGCYGTVLSLRRIASNRFKIADAYTINYIYDKNKNGNINDIITPMAKAVSFLPSILVKGIQESHIKHGRTIMGSFPNGTVSIINAKGDLIAIGNGTGSSIEPKTVFA